MQCVSVYCTYVGEDTSDHIICVVDALVSQLNIDSKAREISV
jgi:hypothetical protein